MHSIPYWRLSGFYFFHFAFIGAFAPYWSLYLKSLSFGAFQIGVLMSLLHVTRIFAPAAWGWLADYTGKRLLIVRWAAVTGLISYCGFFLGESFAWIFVVMALMSFFWSASLPLIEATTLSYLGESTSKYGRIRVWGSVGFIFAVTGIGYLLDATDISSLLWAVLGFKLGIVIFSRQIPEAEIVVHSADGHSVRQIFERPEVLAFFAACLLMALAHGPYYTFYSIYLVEHGYSKSTVGWLWATGVACEIGIFFLMPQLMQRFRLKQIMAFSLSCAIARFLMIGWGVDFPVVILVAQVLHAATYGAHHATSMMLVHQFFRGRHQAKGQALYTSLTFGLGGAAGGILSGYAWEWLGPGLTFTLSAAAVLLGLVLVIWKMNVDPRV
ncbi:MFS transporter, PPP family, 3-phenylpropionic acid transporter [Nitrosospira briensis]|uniref:MFS transporter, PPP family, 3-phenylpropionic acid transporter n=1 Tax=Nitrosospira briensis TaxID=35799 RepID=A0A1I5DDJ2_9PROT|nr:MFS transporter [Nitrosospira briensis]SFN97334.1 MFS transporter, PPP family, 3-phenylpropionic acid transporter [Nitrosospira briensis]